MTIRGKEIDLSAMPIARELAAQDLKGLIAVGFFAVYLITALLA